MRDHRRLALVLLAMPLLVGAVLRATLILADPGHRSDLSALPVVIPFGVLWDLAVWPWLAAPVFLWLALRQSGPRTRQVMLVAWSGAVLLLAGVEWAFWDEFSSRFNHVAIDYLLFPKEVAINIWESFPIGSVLGAVVVGALALGWLAARVTGPAIAGARRRDLAGTGAVVAVAALLAWCLPAQPSEDRELNELANNGLAALVRAVRSASIDYPAHYATLPAERAAAIMAAEGSPFAHRPRPATVVRDRPYDVLVVVEESLGAEFAAGWGGDRDLTPQLDAWKARGTAVLDCVPTGNRTVRGLEALLTGLPPVPPDSVVKRPGIAGIASLAQAFRSVGHRAEFFYGGAAAFDNLGAFAEAAGFQAMHDDPPVGASTYPPTAFRTAWGVADEVLFDAVLARQVAAQRHGESLFLTALTVSNHKPFLVPGDLGRPRPTPPEDRWRAIEFLFWAAILVAGLLAALRRLGWTVVIAGAVVLPGAGGGYAWSLVGPRDSRDAGVRYADAAVGQYLQHAAEAGVLDHTVVLVVGDHGARVYGRAEIPLPSYRVLALLVHPDPAWQGRVLPGLCSQIDLPPTLCSLAGLSAPTPFPGVDLSRTGQGPGRAFVQHNRNIGLMTEDYLAVLGLKRQISVFQRIGPTRTNLARLPPAEVAASPGLRGLTERAQAWFQTAERLIREQTYRADRLDALPGKAHP